MNIESLWEYIVRTLPNGIVLTDVNNKILFINNWAAQFYLPDYKCYDLLPSWLIPQDDNSEYLAAYKNYEIHVTRKKYSLQGKQIICLLLYTDTKITADADELYIAQTAFDAITDLGLMMLDTKGRVVLYNGASAYNDGMEPKEVIGRYASEVFSHQTASTAQEVLRTGRPVIDQEIIYSSKKGKLNYCFGSTYPIQKDGKMIGSFSVIRFNDSARRLLLHTIELQKELLETRVKNFNGTQFKFDNIIGESKSMKRTVEMANKAALTPSNILIYGETGTGKELFAQSIHNASIQRDKPFIAINCAAISESLLESILFGTTKGAFTGAQSTPGLFEQAGEGTLFLDEINSMPMILQAKLLRVLQEKTVRRLGAQEETLVRCRIISSCNKLPQKCVQNGTLRDDLYYRISVVCIEILPLRERKEDILLLANYYIQKYAPIYGVGKIKMTQRFKDVLLMHQWPGNARELKHVIESALVFLDAGKDLDIQHLQPHFQQRYMGNNTIDFQNEFQFSDLKGQIAEFERKVILCALKKFDWNVSQVAREIGYTRSNLQYRMRKLGITEE